MPGKVFVRCGEIQVNQDGAHMHCIPVVFQNTPAKVARAFYPPITASSAAPVCGPHIHPTTKELEIYWVSHGSIHGLLVP